MTIELESVDGTRLAERGPVNADRTFQLEGLSAENYSVDLEGLPEGAYLKAVRVAGRDLPSPEIEIPADGAMSPVELLVSFDTGKVAGLVKSADIFSGDPPPVAAVVILFPHDGQSPYLDTARASTQPDGGFNCSGVPPGAYTAFAVSRNSKLDWEDPQIRKQFEEYGKTVRVESAKLETLELRLVPEEDR